MRRRVILVLGLLLSACSAVAEQPATITADDIAITAMASPPTGQRIVALANGSAEILYALGAGSALVGRDVASTFNGDRNVPIVTAAHSISAEKVIAQQPSLVLIDDRSGPREAIDQIKAAGITVASVPDAWTLSDMAIKIRAIGRITGLNKEAEQLDQELQSALSRLPQVKRVRVAFLYLRGTASIYLIGGKGSGADALLSGIGALDVGARAGLGPFTPLTSEALAAANPDVLLLMTKGLESVGGIEGLVKLPGVAQTNAGKFRRVITVDDSLLLSFGPRTPELMRLLATRIDDVMK